MLRGDERWRGHGRPVKVVEDVVGEFRHDPLAALLMRHVPGRGSEASVAGMFTKLLAEAANAGQWRTALKIYRATTQRRIEPTLSTFTILITACRRAKPTPASAVALAVLGLRQFYEDGLVLKLPQSFSWCYCGCCAAPTAAATSPRSGGRAPPPIPHTSLTDVAHGTSGGAAPVPAAPPNGSARPCAPRIQRVIIVLCSRRRRRAPGCSP